MMIQHSGSVPEIDDSSFIAPTAVICGNVKIGANTRIMYGATIIAEGGSIEIGDNCVVMENAVLRSMQKHTLSIGNHVLIGPNTHVVGCTIEDNVFVATGAAIFHGARLCKGSEVRINGVVHTQTVLPENQTVPIGWVAVGSPAEILSPDQHDAIWEIQKQLKFNEYVYGVSAKTDGESLMPEIMAKLTSSLENYKKDTVID